MKVRYMLERPEAAEATLKITQTVAAWEQLRDQLESKWPSSELSSAITRLLTDARRVIYAPEQEAL